MLQLLTALALLAPTPPDTDLPTMARLLAELRAEIDQLDAALRVEKTQANAALRGLEARVADLQMRLDAERIHEGQLEARRLRYEATQATRAQANSDAATAVERSLEVARALVEEGLPFRRAGRLRALDALRAKLETGAADPHSVGVELWRFMEDERRLRGEVEMSEIPVTLGEGEPPRLSRVVRLGMLTLYTRLGEDRFGQIKREGAGWRHVEITDPAQLKQVADLFQSLRRQVREGAWRLPLEVRDAR